jgi:ammonia channel protein AmtB
MYWEQVYCGLAGLVSTRFCIRSIGIAVQALGTTTVAAAAAGMAWVFLDKILGHKLQRWGACIGTVVGLVAILLQLIS